MAATDDWLLACQARVHGIARPLGPITMTIALRITERDICRKASRGITNKQCLARNLAVNSRAPLEIISLATQSPALNCWSSLDSVHTGDDSTRLNTKGQPCSGALL